MSPLIDATSSRDLRLRFRHRWSLSSGANFTLLVQASLDGTKWGMFRQLQPSTWVSAHWQEVDLSALDGYAFRLAFAVSGDTAALWRWAVGEVRVLRLA